MKTSQCYVCRDYVPVEDMVNVDKGCGKVVHVCRGHRGVEDLVAKQEQSLADTAKSSSEVTKK
jgi:hypothetical protein